MPKVTITPSDVEHIAKLTQVPVSAEEKQQFAKAFAETLTVAAELQQAGAVDTEPTHQVTGLENIWREDEINEQQMFTQEEALANSQETHDGYFVVPGILEETDR